MKNKIILLFSLLFTYQTFACVDGNCCTSTECIEKQYLSNQGITELTEIMSGILSHKSSMKNKIVSAVESRELSFLDKLARDSKSPTLKKLYRSCKKNIVENYSKQVHDEYKLDYHDFLGGYDSAKHAVISLKKTREYRDDENGSNLRHYKSDLARVSRFLNNKRIDSFQDDSSDYFFYSPNHTCDFSSLFSVKGDDPGLFKYNFNLSLQDLKSKKFQKTLEALSKKKKTAINLNLKCLFGKNKVSYSSSENELYIESKGMRKGEQSCNVDRDELRKIPGMGDGHFEINPIRISKDSKVFKK